MKLHVHNHNMVIYIQSNFHEIPSTDYLVMAEDGKTDGLTDGRTDGRTDKRTDNTKPISRRLRRMIINKLK